MILLRITDILRTVIMIFIALYDIFKSNLGRQRLYYASPWE